MADTGRTVFADDLFADGFFATGFFAADLPVTISDVTGETQAAGTATLEGEGVVVAVATEYSSIVAVGLIISQSPVGGSSVAPGSTVTITVSLGDAPATQSQASGGWWPDYEHIRRQRLKRQQEIEEAEAEAQKIQDALDREIYLLERKQEAEEADRADLQRLQAIADKYAGKVAEVLPKRVSVAVLNAQDARTRNALEQMRREVEQMLLFEELAIQQVVLLMLDS